MSLFLTLKEDSVIGALAHFMARIVLYQPALLRQYLMSGVGVLAQMTYHIIDLYWSLPVILSRY